MLVEKQVFLLRNVFVPQTVLRYLFFVNFLGGGGNKYPLSGSGYRLPRWESGKGRGSGPQSDLKINEIELNWTELSVFNKRLYSVCRGLCLCPCVVRSFVLLNWYWGIVTVPGSTLSQGTWGNRILTLHLNYVADYTGPLLFLIERTHNYSVDNQGLVPWRLRRVGRSKVRSVSLVRVLSDGKISWARGPKVTEIPFLARR